MKALLKTGFLAVAIFFSGILAAQENVKTESGLLSNFVDGLFGELNFIGPIFNRNAQSLSPLSIDYSQEIETIQRTAAEEALRRDTFERYGFSGIDEIIRERELYQNRIRIDSESLRLALDNHPARPDIQLLIPPKSFKYTIPVPVPQR